MATPLADESVDEDAAFSLTLPTDTFQDSQDPTGADLTYSAALSDGTPLSSTWIGFVPDSDPSDPTYGPSFDGTPANDDVGDWSVRLCAANDFGTACDDFLVTVNNTYDPAQAVADEYATTSTHLLTVDAAGGVLTNDVEIDPTSAPLVVLDSPVSSAQSAPVAMTADGAFTYDPRGLPAFADLGPGESLLDTFEYTMWDGGPEGWTDPPPADWISTATVSITVSSPIPEVLGLDLQVLVNGADTPGPERPFLPEGSDVVFDYTLTNTSNTTLTDVVVQDDLGTSETGDDVVLSLVGGDDDADGLFDQLEAWRYQRTASVLHGLYSGNVSASAVSTVSGLGASDTDVTIYTGAPLGFSISVAVDGESALTTPGPNVNAGDDITFDYAVTNDTLASGFVSVVLYDDRGNSNPADDIVLSIVAADAGDPDGVLGPGETWTRQRTATAVEGPYETTVTAVAFDLGSVRFTGNAEAYYVGTAPPYQVSISDAEAVEGGALFFTILAGRPVGGPPLVLDVSVSGSATAGSDYTAPSGTVSILTGNTGGGLLVPVLDDDAIEATEDLTVVLSGGSGRAAFVDDTALGTIQDDDVPTFERVGEASVLEGDGDPVLLPVTLHVVQPLERDVAATARAANGTAVVGQDVALSEQALVFTPAAPEQVVELAVLGDVVYERDETVALELDVEGATVQLDDAGTVLDDDDPPTLALEDVSAMEGNDGATLAGVPFVLDGPTEVPPALHVVTTGVSATGGDDYEPIDDDVVLCLTGSGLPCDASESIFVACVPLTGQARSCDLQVALFGDVLAAPDETFDVTVTLALDAQVTLGSGTVTIVNDDGQTELSAGDATAAEGDGELVLPLVAAPANEGPITVSWTLGTDDPDLALGELLPDYQAEPQDLTVPAGQALAELVLPITDNDRHDADHALFWDVTAEARPDVTVADGRGDVVITDDDPLVIGFADPSRTVVEGAAGETTEVVLGLTSNRATSVPIPLSVAFFGGTATADADLQLDTVTLDFPEAASVRLTVIGDDDPEPDESADLQLQLKTTPTGVSLDPDAAHLEITDDDNEAPVAQPDSAVVPNPSDGSGELVVDAPLGVLVNDTDANEDTLEAQLVDAPTNGTVVLQASGAYVYTPAAGFDGLDEFTYVADDGEAQSAPATVHLEVVVPLLLDGAGDALSDDFDEPCPLPDPTCVPVGQTFGFEGHRTCTAPSGSASSALTPAAETTIGEWRGEASADFPPDPPPAEGSYVAGENDGEVLEGSLAVTGAPDGQCEAVYSAYEVLTVTDAIRLSGAIEPWWANGDASMAAELGFDITVWAVWPDNGGRELVLPSSRFSAGPFTPPVGGGVVDGNLNAVPFDTGVLGGPWPAGTVFEVSYDADVGDNTGWVLGIDDVVFETVVEDLAPVAHDDTYGVDQGRLLGANVLDNDHDPEGDALTASLETPPANAADFALSDDGSFVYQTCEPVTEDSFSYLASDGLDDTQAQVSIVVTPTSVLLAALLQDVRVLRAPFLVRSVLSRDVRDAIALYRRGGPVAEREAVLKLRAFRSHLSTLRRSGLSAADARSLREAAQRITASIVACLDPLPRFPPRL